MSLKKRKIELRVEPATSYDVNILDDRVKQLEGLISDEDGITVDFSDYYRKQEVDELISNVDVDLSNYATIDLLTEKQDVIEDLEDIRSLANSAIQEHQSLDDYATIEMLDEEKYRVDDQLSAKQDVIDDIEEIRAGAALGSTALQTHQSLAEYAKKSEIPDISGKQDIISDLADIRSKANSALQSHQDISGKQDVITDLAAIRAGAAAGATALQEHQSLANYYTKTEIDAQLDGLDAILVKILE